MAAPHPPAPRGRRYHFAPLSEWLAFFFGTGPRFLTSMFIVLVTLGVIFPEGTAMVADRAGHTMAAALGSVLQSVLEAVWPYIRPIAQLAIVVLGIRWIIAGPPRWLGGGRRGNRNN